MGTPDFISPEQAQDGPSSRWTQRHLQPRHDLVLSVIRKITVLGRIGKRKLRQHAESEPVALDAIREDVDPELLNILSRMIAKDPAERFQSPAEIAAALRPFAKSTKSVEPRLPNSSLINAALLAAAVFGLIFYVQTNFGTIRIEVEDPNLKVEVVGEEITINAERPLRIRPGVHTLKIEEQGSWFTYISDDFTVKRGQTTVLRATIMNDSLRITQDGETIGARVRPRTSPAELTNERMPIEIATQTESKLDAGEVLQKLRGGHGDVVEKLAIAISSAAGIPNHEWQEFAKSPIPNRETVQGSPLSLVLLNLIHARQIVTDLKKKKGVTHEPQRATDFQLLGTEIAKPAELSAAMALSTGRGYYSLIQPQYLTDLTYQVEATDKTNQLHLTGRAHFNGLGLFRGRWSSKRT